MRFPAGHILPDFKQIKAFFLGFVLLWLAYWVAYDASSQNYLVFHTFTEMFTIVVSFAITLIIFHNYKHLKNSFIPIIGITFAFAGVFDLLHILSYKGLGVFPGDDGNLPTQMWIIARYLDGIGMLLAGISVKRSIKPPHVLIAYVVVSAAALLAVFHWRIFPVCFVEGQGLTPFKIYSEYIISLILVASFLLLVRQKNQFHPKVYRLLLLFFLTSICTELTFTLYKEVYGMANFIGHIFKTAAFYFLYRAIVETSLKEPFNLLFYQLNQANELLKANEVKLLAANKELKSYASIVAHDFRAPLVNLKGFSQELGHALAGLRQLMQAAADKLPEDVQRKMDGLQEEVTEALSFIHAAVDKMDRMVAALLKLSRFDRCELDYEKIDLNKLVENVLRTYNHQIEQKKIQVEVGALPHIVTDHLAMEQIISNLLDNAIKYLVPGRPGIIKIYGRCTGNEATFCIQDNGRGIAMGDREKIFEIFQRVGNQDVAGDGMGLAYVSYLIRRLGGKVCCESEPGVGTIMSITVYGDGNEQRFAH